MPVVMPVSRPSLGRVRWRTDPRRCGEWHHRSPRRPKPLARHRTPVLQGQHPRTIGCS